MVKYYKSTTYIPPRIKVKDLRPRRVLCTSTTENFELKGLDSWQKQQIDKDDWGDNWDATN